MTQVGLQLRHAVGGIALFLALTPSAGTPNPTRI
jgi:hypothetical protein